MDDRGEIHFILGMEVKRDRSKRVITISQKSYLETVLDRFGMTDCNPVTTPLETGKRFQRLRDGEETVDLKQYQAAIGSLNYAAIATRPDLSLAIGMLSQHMVSPGKDHWSGVKRVLRYVRGSLDFGLRFEATSADDFNLHGYSERGLGRLFRNTKVNVGPNLQDGEFDDILEISKAIDRRAFYD